MKRHRFITPMGTAKAAIGLSILTLGWLPPHAAGDATMVVALVASVILFVSPFVVAALFRRREATVNRWSCPPHASGYQVAEMKALSSSYGFLAVICILSAIAFFSSRWLPENWAAASLPVRQISSVLLAGGFFAQSMVIVRRDRLLAALSR